MTQYVMSTDVQMAKRCFHDTFAMYLYMDTS